MQLPNEFSPKGHAALVECLKIAAARGRVLRLAREQAELERAKKENRPALASGGGSPSDATATKDGLSYVKI